MAQRILTRLGKFGASNPVAEIDQDLRRLTADLKACQVRGETAMVERLRWWIDLVLEERTLLALTAQGLGQHRRAGETAIPVPNQRDSSRAHTDEPC